MNQKQREEFTNNLIRELLQELSAVLTLHAPQEITLPDGSWGKNCAHCDGWIYPCETAKLICNGQVTVDMIKGKDA